MQSVSFVQVQWKGPPIEPYPHTKLLSGVKFLGQRSLSADMLHVFGVSGTVILLLLAQWSHCVATARRLVTLQVSATVSQFATTVGSLDTLQRVVQLRKWEFPRHVSATTATDLDTLQWTVPMRRLATTVDSQDT